MPILLPKCTVRASVAPRCLSSRPAVLAPLLPFSTRQQQGPQTNQVVSLLFLQPLLCPAKSCMRVLQNLMPSGDRQGQGQREQALLTSGPTRSSLQRCRVLHSPADCFSDKTAFPFLTQAKLLFSLGLCAGCAQRASPPWTLFSHWRGPPAPSIALSVLGPLPGLWGGPAPSSARLPGAST